MGSLKKWLQNRNQESIMEMLVVFAQKVHETVVEFEKGFHFLVSENEYSLAKAVLSRVMRLEHEADQLRKEILLNVTKSEMDAATREDLVGLVNSIDDVANAANAAARRLAKMQEKHFLILGKQILDMIKNMLTESVEASKIMLQIIKKFISTDNTEILRLTGEIQRYEQKCDVIHTDIVKAMTELNDFPFNPFVAIDIKDVIDMMEAISDKIEEVAEFVELLKIVLR
jgi:predicted phosphate transport protein (TIGR00153 family)